MNKILLLFSVLSYGVTLAQENDSIMLRINKIAEVKKMQFIHAFPNNKDTCLLDHKKLDKQYRLTYQKVDMQCMGWPGYDETFLTYNDKGLTLVSNNVDGVEKNNTSFWYTKNEEKPVKTVLFLRETMDSIVTNTRYFRNKTGRLDSFIAVVKNQDGSTIKTTNIARYDVNGNLNQLYVIDQKRKPLQMMSFEFDILLYIHPLAIGIYLIIIGILMASRLPTFATKKIAIHKEYISLILVLFGLIIGIIIIEPWLSLTIIGLLYIVSFLFSIKAFRKMSKNYKNASLS